MRIEIQIFMKDTNYKIIKSQYTKTKIQINLKPQNPKINFWNDI